MRMLRLDRLAVLLFLIAMLTACASPVGFTESPMERFDKNTTYRIDERAGGFLITVYYERYQFIPESDAVAIAAQSALTSIAHDYAEGRGKKIQQINDQRIKISMGRNGLTGITSCSLQSPVDYAN